MMSRKSLLAFVVLGASLSVCWIDDNLAGDSDVLFRNLKRHQDAFARLQRRINATIQLSDAIKNESEQEDEKKRALEVLEQESSFNATYRRLLDKMSKLNISGEDRDIIIGDLNELHDAFNIAVHQKGKSREGVSVGGGSSSQATDVSNKTEDALRASLAEFKDLEDQFQDLKEFFTDLKKLNKKRKLDDGPEPINIV